MTEIERNLFAISLPPVPVAAASRAGWQKFNFPCAIRVRA